MKNLLLKLKKSTAGATAIEYGLIAALISIAIIVGATAVGTQLDATFDKVGTELKTANEIVR